ncbi:hypothetical protein FZW96_21155 [Bacillus sp. BGMRC 2118]|nr:hypothetical protein FZW96_21155 [Bacillus sp. BGMRC 2118]
MKKLFSLLILPFFFVTGCSQSELLDSNNESYTDIKIDTSPPKKEAEVPDTIGLDTQKFREQFNQAAIKYGFNFFLPDLVIDQGPSHDTFSFEVEPGFQVNGIVNKLDSSIREAHLIKNPDNIKVDSKERNLIQYTLSRVLVGSVSPDLTEEEMSNIFSEINLSEVNIDETTSGDTVYNGHHYINTNQGLIIKSE